MIGDSFEAQIAGEDVVAALTVRGLFLFPRESSWSNKPYACIAADRSDFTGVQGALKMEQDEEVRPMGVVLLYGRLDGERLAWACVGAAEAVAIELDLETFFAVDLKARNAERNKALACMEKAAGDEGWQTLHSLL